MFGQRLLTGHAGPAPYFAVGQQGKPAQVPTQGKFVLPGLGNSGMTVGVPGHEQVVEDQA